MAEGIRPVVGLLVAAVTFASGCGGTMYVLPAPPPPGERRSVSLIPGTEESEDDELLQEARATVRTLHRLLQGQRYVEALDWLSAETRDFLAYGDEEGRPEEALARGALQLPDGQRVEIDPLELLVAPDVSTLEDEVPGVEDQETDRRKVLFAIPPGGEPRQIVVIREGDRWVVHRTGVAAEALERTLDDDEE